jgi:hypothetical protein
MAIYDLAEGRRRRDEGIDLTSDNNKEWLARAIKLVLAHRHLFPGDFLADEFRRIPGIGQPRKDSLGRRNWGSLISALAKAGYVEQTGAMAPSKLPQNHASPYPVWRFYGVRKMKSKRVILEDDVTPEKVIASKAEILGREETLQNRYRPAFLDEILGHDEVIAAIRAAIKAGERAFVLTGISGVGKTTMALRFAEEVIGASGDQIIPLDAAKFNGVETMTTLSDTVERHRDHPFLTGGLRVYILDEVHAITKAGWSVLLNALENLPPGWYFFLLTNDLDKVPPEIKSQRCAVFELLPVPRNDIMKILNVIVKCEEWSTPKEIRALCAQESLGSPRRAITHLGACYHCTDRDQAARLIRAEVTKTKGDWGYKLAQALRTPIRSELQRILRDAKAAGEHPTGMRLVVCSYFESVAENAKDDDTLFFAAMVLNNFADDVTVFAHLWLAVIRTYRESNNGK